MAIPDTQLAQTDSHPDVRVPIDRPFMALLRHMVHAPTRDEAIMNNLSRSAAAIAGVDHVAVVTVSRARRRVPSLSLEGASSTLAEELSLMEIGSDDGPIHRATTDRCTVACSETTGDSASRYLLGMPAPHTVRSVLAIPLLEPTHSSVFAVATFWSERDEVMPGDVHGRATAVSDLLALALGAAAMRTQFDAALQSRDVIGQAKGMIMERYDISADEAFALLARLSQDTNTPLVAVATKLTDASPPADTGAD
ncbi:MAG: ANTAR domain-containing protein [Corynebacteriales bacterium]|nr:ANTAR domain-containing protein [Mycobacteriales bacterium]